jgi:hypothetical protein
MAHHFSLKELMNMRKSMAQNKPTTSPSTTQAPTQTTPIEGKTVLEKLEKVNYMRNLTKVNNSNSSSSGTTTQHSDASTFDLQSTKKRSIAICMVCVDKIPHEDIWKKWQTQSETCEYDVDFAIHAKFPDKIQSVWAKKYTLPISFMPEWNSPEVIRAMLATLEKALENQNNERFVFVTGNVLMNYILY